MKTDFIQPRFTGDRFEQATLPVDVARDLAAYEVLVVELAKHLYLQDHLDRQRVPKGFSSGFHLHIDRIDPGSAQPMLALVTAGAMALFASGETYFSQARDLISECIAADDAALPARFPKELLSHFNQLGRSLRDGEALELPRAHAVLAVLTPERRKNLVLAADQFYEREVELTGSIAEADWEKSTFRLRLPDSLQTIVPMPHSFHAKAREFGGRTRHQVSVKGIATYDSWDRLQKVVSVDSLEIHKNHFLASKFDELADLKDGWHEGRGVAPDKDRLAAVAEKLTTHYPERLPMPILVPTQDGNLLLEWDAQGEPSLDIVLGDWRAHFHSFGDGHAEVEQEFRLDDEAVWNQLFAFLNEQIKARVA